MKNKLKIILIYAISYICFKVELKNIDRILFHEYRNYIPYLLTLTMLNIVSILLVKFLNIKHIHLLALLSVDLLLIAGSMIVGNNILWIVTAIYFVIACIVYYLFSKHEKSLRVKNYEIRLID